MRYFHEYSFRRVTRVTDDEYQTPVALNHKLLVVDILIVDCGTIDEFWQIRFGDMFRRAGANIRGHGVDLPSIGTR
jgi:hypothetical protein